MYKYGHFSDDNLEFVITNPNTPRDFDNYLFNDAIYSYVQQTGVGYSMYQIDGKETTLLSSIVKDVHYDRDTIMNRLIYVRDNDTGEIWNINWEPIKKETEYYRCRHGLGYTIIETKVDDLEASFRIFVPDGNDPVELWTIALKNTGDKKRNLSLFTYYEFTFTFTWGFDAYGYHIYMHSYFDEGLNSLIAQKHPEKKPHNYLTGFMASDVKVDKWDGSKEVFVGRYNKLNEPQKIIDGDCSNTEGTSEFVVGAMQYDIELQPNVIKDINIVLGVTDSPEAIKKFRDKFIGNFEEYFIELKEKKQKMINTKVIKTPDSHLNRMLNIWLKQQILYGSVWTRWGMRGYRDILQHAYGITDIYPEITKEVLLKALKYQYKSGAALRGWDPLDTKEYSDSALWLIFTLTNYLKETGDLELLNIEMPYLEGGSATVLEHMEKALDYMEGNKGIHGLNLIKFGDWNDSLTGIGKEGRGESVWLSMAYSYALLQIIELTDYLKLTDKKQKYEKRYQDMKDSINKNAWDGEWYLGCYTDSYRKIYSKESEEGSIYINTQSWAVISEVSDEKRTNQLLNAIDERLLTDHGYLLSYPTFKSFDPEIGRITAMEPGIAENGTIYSHGNSFMYFALLKLKLGDKAYDIFKRITPGYLNENSKSNKSEDVPYVYTNCYYGPDHRRSPFEMEYSWITGSVGWFFNLTHQWLMGVRKEYNGLYIDPVLPSEWDNAEIEFQFRGKKIEVKINNVNKGNKKILLNGKEHETKFIALSELAEENLIEVV